VPGRAPRPAEGWPLVVDIIVDCPVCGEPSALGVDTAEREEQSRLADCPTCRRPMEVYVRCRPGEVLSISVTAD
jgi:Cysteine-rich CPXCG